MARRGYRYQYRVVRDRDATDPQRRYRAERRLHPPGALWGLSRWKEFAFDEGNWASGPEPIRYSSSDAAMEACLANRRDSAPRPRFDVVWSLSA